MVSRVGIMAQQELAPPGRLAWSSRPNAPERALSCMAILSTMVGAMVLSRAVDDEQLSKQFLQAAAKSVMGLSAGAAQKDSSDDDGFSSRVPRRSRTDFGNLFTARGELA